MATIRKDVLYKLESNEKLFEKFQDLKRSLDHVAGIVQNDMEFKGKEIEGWIKAYKIVMDGFKEVFDETQMYIAMNLKEVDFHPELPPSDEFLQYDFVWEDADGEIHRDKTTEKEFDTFFAHLEANGGMILKMPKFPAKE